MAEMQYSTIQVGSDLAREADKGRAGSLTKKVVAVLTLAATVGYAVSALSSTSATKVSKVVEVADVPASTSWGSSVCDSQPAGTTNCAGQGCNYWHGDCNNPNGGGTCNQECASVISYSSMSSMTDCGWACFSCQKFLLTCGCPAGTSLSGSSCVCQGGHYRNGDGSCSAYSGGCANGNDRALASRTGHAQCDGCHGGYYQCGDACCPYGGGCGNGDLIAQGSRRQDNHCGSCHGGYFLNGYSCSSCGGGQYNPSFDGTTTCYSCPSGQYQPHNTQTGCINCPVGQEQPSQGQTGCGNCAAGKIAPNTGTANCPNCAVGKYQPSGGQTACPNCPVGKLQPSEGQTACPNCPVGKVQPSEGQTACPDCAVGQVQPSEGQTACPLCAVGKFQPSEGQTVCPNCAPGMVQPTTGTTVCVNCAVGQYQPSDGETVCPVCVPGKFMGDTGATACTLCAGPYDSPVGLGNEIAAGDVEVPDISMGRSCTDGGCGCPRTHYGGCSNYGNVDAAQAVSMGIGWSDITDVQECRTLCADRPGCAGFVFGEAGTPQAGHCSLVSAGCLEPQLPSCQYQAYGEGQEYMPQRSRDDNQYNFCRQYDDESGACQAQFCTTGAAAVCPDVCDRVVAAGHVAAAETTAAEKLYTGYYALDTCASKYVAQVTVASTPDFTATDNAWPTGTWQPNAGATACLPWTTCAASTYVLFEGSRHQDRTCFRCADETYMSGENGEACLPWTVCDGSAVAASTSAQGVLTDGDRSTNAVCEDCGAGKVSLTDDTHSRCYSLLDNDGDALYDRHSNADVREQGIRSMTLGRTGYSPAPDADQHPSPLNPGADQYDECPFDQNNDADGDGICAGGDPTEAAESQINANPQFFPRGGPRVDRCPSDPENDKDKDGKCDRGAGVRGYRDADDDVRTWNFFSNNLVGWYDKDCWLSDNEVCDEPTSFEIGSAPGVMPPLGVRMFGADVQAVTICEAEDTKVIAGMRVDDGAGSSEADLAWTRWGAALGEGSLAFSSWQRVDIPVAALGEPAYCDGTALYDGDSADGEDCMARCAADSTCSFASVWVRGDGAPSRCRLTSACDAMTAGDEGSAIEVYAKPYVGKSCNTLCDDEHGMSCDSAKVLLSFAELAEQMARGQSAAEVLTQFGETTGSSEEMCTPHFKRHELLDHQCDDVGRFLACKCVPDPQPLKTQQWSMDPICPGCYATTNEPATLGKMVTEFKIRRNSMSFALSADPAAQTKYVKLTIKSEKTVAEGKRDRLLEDMPTIMELPSATTADWYPVQWDLTQYMGKTALLEVVDMDQSAAIAVDDFTFFNDNVACLPGCMKIEADVLEDGSTCFYIERDEIPYVQVKTALDGNGDADGVYCRQAPVMEGGSILGPGIETMQLTDDPLTRSISHEGVVSSRVNVEGGDAPVDEDSFSTRGLTAYVSRENIPPAAEKIPRCLSIYLRGSHYAISTAEQTLGDDSTVRTFGYFPSDNGVHCVYNTLKPRCLAFSKPSVAFKTLKPMTCEAEIVEFSCLDQCISIHCPEDDTLEEPCGKGRAFRDCAECCDNNDNVASGCFRRRRRRLGDGDGDGRLSYSIDECASTCLNRLGCIAFMVDEGGTCQVADECDKAHEIEGHWQPGKWRVLKDLVGELSPPRPKRKKRKRKRTQQ